MDGITEEHVKRWLTLAQNWGDDASLDELKLFLAELKPVIIEKGSPRAVLQHLPSIGKLLGTLSQNCIVQCSDDVVQSLVSCILGLATHTTESKEDNITKKAVYWAQSQLRNMTSSNCGDSSVVTFGEFIGYTAQETTQTFIDKLVQSICYDLRTCEGAKWKSEISDIVPDVPLLGSCVLTLSKMCISLMSIAAAKDLIEALLLCEEKTTDIITSVNDKCYVTTDSLSPLFIEQISKITCDQQTDPARPAGHFQLSYAAKVNLWRRCQMGFEKEILDLVERTVIRPCPSLSRPQIEEIILSSDLRRACAENINLFSTAQEILCSMLRRTGGNKVLADVVKAFTVSCITHSAKMPCKVPFLEL